METTQSNEKAMSTSEGKAITSKYNIEPHHWGGQRPRNIKSYRYEEKQAGMMERESIHVYSIQSESVLHGLSLPFA